MSLIQLVRNGQFLRNIIMVAAGAAGAQAINLAFTPIVTRLYGPESFGILGIFTAILAVLAPVSALSYPAAIVLPKNNSEALSLIKVSVYTSLITSSLTLCVIIFFKDKISLLLNIEPVKEYLVLLPIALFLTVLFEVMNQWTIRNRKFSIKGKMSVYHASVVNLLKLVVGLYSATTAALIAISTLNSGINAAFLYLGNKDKLFSKVKDSRSSVKLLFLKYNDFACYKTPQALLNAMFHSVPILILSSYFSAATAGYYVLARTVLAVPSHLIGQSVTDVFYPKFVEILNRGDNGRKFLVKSCLLLFSIGIFPYLIIFIYGEPLFDFAFGNDWSMSGSFASWMSIWLFSTLMSRPVVAAIPVLNLQKFYLIYEITSFLMRSGAIILGCWIWSSEIVAVGIFSIVNATTYVFLTIYVLKKS